MDVIGTQTLYAHFESLFGWILLQILSLRLIALLWAIMHEALTQYVLAL